MQHEYEGTIMVPPEGCIWINCPELGAAFDLACLMRDWDSES